VQRIGWHVQNAMASIAIGTAPYSKVAVFFDFRGGEKS
jgi:hypothetical protein